MKPVKKKENTRRKAYTIPTAGTVCIEAVFDGSGLPRENEAGSIVLNAWTSVNGYKVSLNVPWKLEKVDGSVEKQRMSESVRVELPLIHTYALSEYARKIGKDASKIATEPKIAKVWLDTVVYFELLAEECSETREILGLSRFGTVGLPLAALIDASVGRLKKTSFGMRLMLQGGSNGDEDIEEVCVELKSVNFGEVQKEVVRAYDEGKLFESAENITQLRVCKEHGSFIDVITKTAIERSLYDLENEDGLEPVPESREKNAMLRMPFAQMHQPFKIINKLPSAAYFVDRYALDQLPEHPKEDADYMKNCIAAGLRRYNITFNEGCEIIKDQLKRTDEYYDSRMNTIICGILLGFTLLAHQMPYKADTRTVNPWRMRARGSTPSWSRNAKGAEIGKVDVESLDDLLQRGMGDCEDKSTCIMRHFQMLHRGITRSPQATLHERGQWNDEDLDAVQDLFSMYIDFAMIGSVTSPALGNVGAMSDKSTDVLMPRQTAEHWEDYAQDSMMHFDQLGACASDGTYAHHFRRRAAATTATGDGDCSAQHLHTVRYSTADDHLEIGGHSWLEKMPLTKFVRLLERTVKGSSTQFGIDLQTRPWRYYLPHLICEGTGWLQPLLMPSVYYTSCGQDRKSLAARDLHTHRVIANVLGATETLKHCENMARSSIIVNTPFERLTSFYVQSTFSFTANFLDTVGVYEFGYYRIAREVRAHEKQPDPLFENSDALENESVREELNSLRNTRNAEKKMCSALLARVDKSSPARNAQELTMGVDLEERILDRPYAPEIAMKPCAKLDEIEFNVMRAQLRHCWLPEKPSSTLNNFNTGADDDVGYVRVAHLVENIDAAHANPNCPARIVRAPLLMQNQRNYYKRLESQVAEIFEGEPWRSSQECEKQGLALITFALPFYDLTSDSSVDAILSDARALKKIEIVRAARVYPETISQHFGRAIIQFLCKVDEGDD